MPVIKKVKTAQPGASKSFNNVGRIGASFVTDVAGQLASGAVNTLFNRFSEERADDRNRKMLLDQPGITVEGRRRAGLNPYGDATLPGMSTASSIDSSLPNSRTLNEIVALEELEIAKQQLVNDTIVAQSTAAKNNAEAQHTSGTEQRDSEKHSITVKGMELKNDYQVSQNTIARWEAIFAPEASRLSVEEQSARVADLIIGCREKEVSISAIQQQISESVSRIALNDSQIDLNSASIAESMARIEHMSVQDLATLMGVSMQQEEHVYKLERIKAEVARYNQETKNLYREYKWMPVTKITSSIKDLAMSVGVVLAGAKSFGPTSFSNLVTPSSSTYDPMKLGKGNPQMFDAFGNVIQ